MSNKSNQNLFRKHLEKVYQSMVKFQRDKIKIIKQNMYVRTYAYIYIYAKKNVNGKLGQNLLGNHLVLEVKDPK